MARKQTITEAQRVQIMRALRARDAGAPHIRATCAGERVTLASLYYRGFFTRRAWAKANTTSPAHEYAISDGLYEALKVKGVF